MIPEYVIDQILSKDIVSIIGGEGVSLKRAGVNYECCCPFYKEKTPSFKVSPVKGIFTCFGCSAKGNAISFVMMLYNMTFPEAVEYLAKKLNIEYKAEELTPEQKEARFRRSRIFEINQVALEYFRELTPSQKTGTKRARVQGGDDRLYADLRRPVQRRIPRICHTKRVQGATTDRR